MAELPTRSKDFNLLQLLQDAQTRWLKPTEISELLNNHDKLPLSSAPPNRPASGSLFLFDRTKLRYFRKDGHNWRKKKDGKTVREAHEKLKAGNRDLIHCYYAHGEDNPKFQRRSYWLLEGGLEHIVLVHYREVTEGIKLEPFQSSFNVIASDKISNRDLTQAQLQNTVYGNAFELLPPSLVSSPSEVLSPSLNSHEDTYEGDSGEDLEGFQMTRVEHPHAQKTSLLEQLTIELGLDSTFNAEASNASLPASRSDGFTTASKHISYNSANSNLSNAAMFGVPQAQHHVHFDTAAGQESNQGHSIYERDLESVESMDMADLLLDTDGLSRFNKLSNGSSNWSSLLESTLPPMGGDWTELSNQGTASCIASTAPHLSYSSALEETRERTTQNADLLAGPPFKDMSRQPKTILGAHWQALTEQDSFNKNAIKLVKQEVQSPKYYKRGMLNEENRFHELNPSHFGSQIHQQNQESTYPKQEALSMDNKPFNIDQELQGIDNGLLSPNVSDLIHSIQSDGSNRNKKGIFEDLDGIWVVKESEDDTSHSLQVVSSRPEAFWTDFENQYAVDGGSNLPQQVQAYGGMEPSFSQKQCLSILDFTPEWSYCSDEAKVIVSITFLDASWIPIDTKWCCIFGEVEVPAEVLQPGLLRCKAPVHEPGRVSFYVASKDRRSFSEIREFEYRSKDSSPAREPVNDKNSVQKEQEVLLQVRFARLLSSPETDSLAVDGQKEPDQAYKTKRLTDTVGSVLRNSDIWTQIEEIVKEKGGPLEDAKDKILQALIKSQLQGWLVRKSQDPKGVTILDDNGLAALHMAAALGYEWAVIPILAAGTGINFRDVHGWTALHWAAYCGREKVVASLLAAGADPGALSDPTPTDPTGRIAADLAGGSGHGGLAGYLAEASLTNHLSSLNLHKNEVANVSTEAVEEKAVEGLSEKNSVCASFGMTEDQLSLKDTLAAVRNAAQAAARIQVAFRAFSFRKRQEHLDANINEFGMRDEEAWAVAVAQGIQRAAGGQPEKLNLAATQIQCKYRGWKGRKDFLSLKQHVVKIQAHVRGHQARKKFNKVLWTVGVLDKAILRWRRKGQGLRGFRAEENVRDEDNDDDDLLRDFRRQKEEAFEDALSRVKAMIQDPEARNQYRRMLEIYQEEKGVLHRENLIFPDEELSELLGH